MAITAEQVRLVSESYERISRSPRSYSELFYHKLFLQHPFVRALFPDDMSHQILVFERTIDALVENVAVLERLRPTLSMLAQRHVGYGVQASHYAAVGAVLIDTFGQLLEECFTTDIRTAWEAVYTETAGVMISEAYPAP